MKTLFKKVIKYSDSEYQECIKQLESLVNSLEEKVKIFKESY